MLDSALDDRIAAAAEKVKKSKKKPRSKTPSLRQRLLKLNRNSSGSSTDTTITSSRRGSFRSISYETAKSTITENPKKRNRKVRFGGSNMIYPATEDYRGLVMSELWWTPEALESRRVSDVKSYQKKNTTQCYMKDCESARFILQNTVRALQPEDGASTESTVSLSAELALEEEELLSHGELMRFLTEDMMHGFRKGYRGMEGGCFSSRYAQTQKVTQAILSHIQKAKTTKKKRNKAKRKEQKEQQQAALAARSLELTRTHRQWARVLALGDHKAVQGKACIA